MKKILSLSFALAAAMLLASCGGSGSSVEMTSQESVNKNLAEKLTKHIDPEARITDILIMSTKQYSTAMDIVAVELYEPGNDKLQSYNFNLSTWSPGKRNSNITIGKPESDKAVRLADIDFSRIAEYINKGSEMLTPAGFVMAGIDTYSIRVTPEGVVNHSFKLKIKSADGGNLRGAYPIMDYEITPEGEVKMDY